MYMEFYLFIIFFHSLKVTTVQKGLRLVEEQEEGSGCYKQKRIKRKALVVIGVSAIFRRQLAVPLVVLPTQLALQAAQLPVHGENLSLS